MGIVLGIAVEFMATIGWVFAAFGHMPVIAVAIVEVMVHMPIKVLGPVEPGTGPDEYAAIKPLGTVIAVGGAIIGRLFVVAIGAFRRSPDIDTYRDLGFGRRSGCEKQPGSYSGKNYLFQAFHCFLLSPPLDDEQSASRTLARCDSEHS